MNQTTASKTIHTLSDRLIELEQTKKAMINILEDLEFEKQKITNEKAQAEAILASIGEGLVVTDVQGKIILVNKMFEQLMGLHSTDVIGYLFTDIVPAMNALGKSIPPNQRPIHQVLQGASFSEINSYSLNPFRYQSKDRIFPVAVKASPIVIHDVLVGAVEVFRDVTKEQEIDQAKSEFVSLAGHQLRTPVSVINWFTELLLEKIKKNVDPTERDYLETIYSASKRMGRLINQLLNVSRIDVGSLQVEPVPTDLAQYLQNLIVFIETSEHTTTQFCKINLILPNEPIPPIYLDHDLMHQVFSNLLVNAINYSPKSTNCRVTLNVQVPKDNAIIISVTDHGIGIPLSAQQKIFDRMYRADNAIREVPDGNGLGLYIAKKILTATNGDIWFESTEGKGTTFFVKIPLSGMQKLEGTKKLED